MRAALREARRGIGLTSPNPAVGAVIVRGGRIVARGWHRAAGSPHAEIEALAALRSPSLAKGAALYVTLEPCSTHGRTPPCTEAIVGAGFGRVIAGATDPNPNHAGLGFDQLRNARIEVRTGVLSAECAAINAPFNKWIVSGLPWVIAKAGISMDGRLTRSADEGQWITGEASRTDAMRLRARADAILIGANTLRHDNPRLTVRGVADFAKTRQPLRVVLTSGKRALPSGAHLFTDEHRDRTRVFRGKALRAVLRELGRAQVTCVLIEGGMHVLGQAFDGRLVDEVCFYMAPILCGGPAPVVGGKGAASSASSTILIDPSYKKIGADLRLTGHTASWDER